MDDRPRSTRPTPRTPAAIEAELRRRLRTELSEARVAAEDAGEPGLDDATLAGIIARAIGTALALHLEAEHARGPRPSNAGWRSAPGPRGGPGQRPQPQPWPPEEFEGGPPGPRPPRPPFRPPRGPRPFDFGPREGFDPSGPPPRYPRQPSPGPRGGRRPPPPRGGFGPRKPRRGP